MAEFLTTLGTSSYIEKILLTAKERVYLVSPYLQFSRHFHERLLDVSEKGIAIVIVYGKNQLHKSELNLLKEIPGLTLTFCDNLHAKCYHNESDMVITSMNMYEYSERNNREMGIGLTKSSDSSLFENAANEVQSIIRSSKIEFQNALVTDEGEEEDETGSCIRCGSEINFDPERPMCRDCYYSWNNYGNPYYKENNCHGCGKKEATSMAKPLCKSCY